MTTSDDRTEFAALIERARAGDEEAARTLFDHYRAPILALLRRELMGPRSPLRRDLDSSDVAQEAWLSAFKALRDGKAFPNPQSFVAFLKVVTTNCFRMCYRAHVRADKRSARHEQGADLSKVVATDCGPAQAAEGHDACQAILAHLSERDQAIVKAIAEGGRVADVAAENGVSVRTVERVLEHLRRAAR